MFANGRMVETRRSSVLRKKREKKTQKNKIKTEHHIIIKYIRMYTYYVVTLVKNWADRNGKMTCAKVKRRHHLM